MFPLSIAISYLLRCGLEANEWFVISEFWLMRLIPCNLSDMTCSSVQSCARNRFVESLTTPSHNQFPQASSLRSTGSPKSSRVRWWKRPEQCRRNGPWHTIKLRGPSSRPNRRLPRRKCGPKRRLELRLHNPTQQRLRHLELPFQASIMASRKNLTQTKPGPPPLRRTTQTLHRHPLLEITSLLLRHCINPANSRRLCARTANSDPRPTPTRVNFYLHTCVKRCDARNVTAKAEASVSRG